jgi:hypothetical protein
MNRDPLHRETPGREQFIRHEFIDEEHQGMVVASFEHPRQWQAHSYVSWNYDNVSVPAISGALTLNPNGTESLEFLPMAAFFWLEPNFMYTPGQSVMGQLCLPPMRAGDALLQQVIPKYRGDRENLRIVRAEAVPNLAQNLKADELNGIPNEGVKARIEYTEDGQMFEEEFYACAYWQPPNGGQINWGLARLACFRTARGELEASRQTFWRILTSLRANPQWQQLHSQISQQIFSGFKQMHAGFRQKIKDETEWAGKLRDERKRQAEQQSAEKYTRHEAMGDILRGQTAYDDPNSEYGNPHYVQGSPLHVWTDNNGNWIESYTESYNPNLDPTVDGNWVEARERKVGE